MYRIVIASDSFKGSLSSMEVAEAAARGINAVLPECQTTCLEVADGGEGTSKVLTRHFDGQIITTSASDPLGRRIRAEYGIVTIDGKQTAIIEMAQASGLPLLSQHERNPLLTSTYGTGEMILDAARKGCRRFLIGIGGSATNDGGTGMLEALGFTFTDKDGARMLGLCGKSVKDIYGIDSSTVPQEILDSEFIIACDVDTPFCGPEGASAVFGPQKGATPEMVSELEEGMQNLNAIISRKYGTDLSSVPGSGAAGGLGGAFLACLGAELKRGIDMVLDSIGFDSIIRDASLVVTGEGKLDGQTQQGKVISGIAARANTLGVPVIAIAGIVDMNEEEIRRNGLAAAFPIGPRPQTESDLKYAMRPEVASVNITETVAKALESLSPSLFRESL